MIGKISKKFLKFSVWVVGIGVFLAIVFVTYMAIAHHQTLILPSPTGPFQVGRSEWDWVDKDRPDPLADVPGKNRELSIWVWFPAQANTVAPVAPFLPPTWAKAKAADDGLGTFLEWDMHLIQTHSFLNGTISSAQSTYPVLIFQPGFGPAVSDYTVFAENLASHGYIVLGINETDSQYYVAFPDGRVVYRSNTGNLPDNADPATIIQDENQIGVVWAQDVVYVMNQLEIIHGDPSNPFYHELDLTHVGVWGHSFGGAIAIAVCQKDPRCQAGANLDGTPLSDTADQPIPKPFLFVSEGLRFPFPHGCQTNKNCQPLLAAYQQARGPAYFVTVNGAKHFNFSDRPYRSLLPTRLLLEGMGIVGSIDPARGLEVTNAYLVAFFDLYLKGVSSPLLSGSTITYPEVQLASHSP